MFQGTGALAFNATFYLQNNPDVLTAISNGTFQGTALDHFIQFGQFEVERDPNQFFDTEYYLAQNPDVLAAIIDPANTSVTSAFQHFVMFGFEEGLVRRPSAAFETFTPGAYLAQNPDLQAAFADVPQAELPNVLFQHFLQFGVNEDRPGTGVIINPGVPGLNLLFTGGDDVLVGSVNNDTFTGAQADIGKNDSVDGGAGFDSIVVTSATGVFTAPTAIKNIEEFRFEQTGAVTTNLSSVAGIERVVFDADATVTVASSEVAVVFDGAASGTDAAIKYTSGTTGAVEVTNGASLDAVTFTNVTATNATNSITTVNVVSSGSGTTGNSINSIAAGAALVTLNISGGQDLTIAGLGDVTTVNGAAAGGDLNLTFTATKDVTVTGGAGDDRFDFGGTLTKADTVNGGAGDNVVVVDGKDYSSTAAGSAFNGLTNIQTVEFDGLGGATLNGNTFTNASITNLRFNTTGDDIVNAAGSARTYEFGTDNDGSATFNLKAGATELNVDLVGSATGTADVVNLGVNLAGGAAAGSAPTINLTSSGDLAANTANSVASINAVAGSTVVVDGSADLEINGAAASITIDASGFSGDLVVQGSQVAATNATAAADAAVGVSAALSGVDSITLGSGTNIVEFNSGLDSGVFVTTGGTSPTVTLQTDVITGFTAGTDGDVLNFIQGAGVLDVDAGYTVIGAAQATIDALAGADATLINAANIAVDVAGAAGWTAFSFQGEAYALYNAAGSGAADFDVATDVLVNLSGVTVASLVDANFA